MSVAWPATRETGSPGTKIAERILRSPRIDHMFPLVSHHPQRRVLITRFLAAPIAAVVALAAFGCESTASPPAQTAPQPRSACWDARAWQDELEHLPASAVLKVEPKYQWYMCRGTATVTGTTLLLRPAAVPSEQTARMLECPRQHLYLTGAEHPDSDHMWIPSGWMDLNVESRTGAVAITLSAESVPKNIRLLHDTHAFVTTPRGTASRAQ